MKVCVVTGTRAEFGLLKGLMKLIEASDSYELQVAVTGTHLLEEFGYTVNEISDAGFSIDSRVSEITKALSGRDVAVQIGEGTVGFTDALCELRSETIVVLGDRYEMLAASLAAYFLKIPILHIHGGEVTNGAFDDTIRHSITKLATLHCVAHEDYAQRVIQLGEQPDSVHVVGGLGVDQLAETPLLSKAEIEIELGRELSETVFLVTYHPVTSGVSDAHKEVSQLVNALERFPDASVVVTMPNGDPDHHIIGSVLDNAVSNHQDRWLIAPSLGQVKYCSLMAIASAVIGNSSSGVLEAPSFGTPTVNIGPRQTGRIMGPSVVSCEPEIEEITDAIQKVMTKGFRESLRGVDNPLGGPGASRKIFSLLPKLQAATVWGKKFYDIGRDEWSRSNDH